VQTLLQVLFDMAHRLAGVGALHNAAHEVDWAHRTAADVDAQLGRLVDLPPRRAA
jgi:hypothetical protein